MGLRDLYDPDQYELKTGPAPRVGPLYASVLAGLPIPSRVMELGCGTGDVLLPLARAGHQACGVDNSPEMLRRFRQRLADEGIGSRVELVEGMLPDLPDWGEVDALLMPNGIVDHMLADGLLIELFLNARRLMRPGARLVLDVQRFDVEYLGSLAGPAGALTRTHGIYPYLDATHLRVSEQSRYDPATGVLTCTFQYEELDASGRVRSSWYRVLELFPRRTGEITAVLERARFTITSMDAECFPGGMDSILIQAEAR